MLLWAEENIYHSLSKQILQSATNRSFHTTKSHHNHDFILADRPATKEAVQSTQKVLLFFTVDQIL